MTAMKPHGIKFTEEDWLTIQALAAQTGITPSAFVNLACAQFAHKLGKKWVGGKKRGRPRKNPDGAGALSEIELRTGGKSMSNGYESGESTRDTTIAPQPQEGDCWRVNSEDDACKEYIEDTSHEH